MNGYEKAGASAATGAAAGAAVSMTLGGMGLAVGGTAVALTTAPLIAVGAGVLHPEVDRVLRISDLVAGFGVAVRAVARRGILRARARE